ncbi:hypothetical protein [Rufibacter roseus]|uniref:Phosphopeptide-binding protein n=1 Tax=Rufibacter roseus TaxID=1567108 RepID=A0ABW2DFS8_9BACT|nr:hypothetical protein [Rufibacter roseus]
MKNKHISLLAAVALLFSAAACDSNRTTTTEGEGTDTADHAAMGHDSAGVQYQGTMGTPMEKGGLKVYSYSNSVDFPDAKLEQTAPEENATVAAGEVPFKYTVQNYELSKQTPDAGTHEHANSAEGQHIHNIVDNEPYTAHYTPEFTKKMENGEHVVLSFLSRSYHESIKHPTAYTLREVKVGNGGKTMDFKKDDQHLFYSRPKGEYKGADTKKVMLDFYLVNTTLSPDGNKVRATINGNEFILDQWLPYLIEGLPMGENTFKLELINSQGQVIPGPFNTVTRTVTLKE